MILGLYVHDTVSQSKQPYIGAPLILAPYKPAVSQSLTGDRTLNKDT